MLFGMTRSAFLSANRGTVVAHGYRDRRMVSRKCSTRGNLIDGTKCKFMHSPKFTIFSLFQKKAQ